MFSIPLTKYNNHNLLEGLGSELGGDILLTPGVPTTNEETNESPPPLPVCTAYSHRCLAIPSINVPCRIHFVKPDAHLFPNPNSSSVNTIGVLCGIPFQGLIQQHHLVHIGESFGLA